MEPKSPKVDAGVRSLDHYQHRMSTWRYTLRNALLPLVRWETPYVALVQSTLRTSFLDGYFAMVANLGTHTFYMIMLPVLFWCGYGVMGTSLVHVLAGGVYFTGFLKDLLCLPRPLSPPLHRITMSGSAALEYGFPSTHSANAISVTTYCLYCLRESQSSMDPLVYTTFQYALYFYAASILLGRLYCGMHGFLDILWGSIMGAMITYAQVVFGPIFDDWLHTKGVVAASTMFVVISLLVYLHPEPVDNCPCFDDSVAFAGVVIGINYGVWQFAKSVYAADAPSPPGTVRFDLQKMGWILTTARVSFGVVLILAWRSIMKPFLLKVLPPVFRAIETRSLTLPRRYFLPASQYTSVPQQKVDDKVIPSPREIPKLLSAIGNRKRSVSVGPQSEADVYETLAYREKKRRDSITSISSNSAVSGNTNDGKFEHSNGSAQPGGNRVSSRRRRSSSIEEFRAQMGTGSDHISSSSNSPKGKKTDVKVDSDSVHHEVEAEQMLSQIQKQRIRYDVEVITKLIVYMGIGWIATEGAPTSFHKVGLGYT